MVELLCFQFLVALLVSIACGQLNLEWARRFALRQVIREDGPESHLQKAGTPTMGGVGIVASIMICAALSTAASFGRLPIGKVAPVLWLTASFAAIGVVDDLLKLRQATHRGWKARFRLLLEFAAAATVVYHTVGDRTWGVYVPAGRFVSISGAAQWLLLLVAIVGSGNAVNLTDGLDGLAAGCVASCGGSIAVAAWIHHDQIHSALAVIIAGAAAGFLWVNHYPAQIFMGDVGSLALGGALGVVAVQSGLVLPFIVAGGLMIAEVLSVILQVISFQLTGKRIFRMAPLHHHFELEGWPETTVVGRFWLVSLMLGVAGVIVASL